MRFWRAQRRNGRNPETRDVKDQSRKPKPEPLDTTPQTLNPKLETLKPKPQPLNPTLETLKPKPLHQGCVARSDPQLTHFIKLRGMRAPLDKDIDVDIDFEMYQYR